MKMPAIEKGRVCILSRGRNAGKKAVVLETGGTTANVFVKGREKKCSIRHLFPTKEKTDTSKLKKKPKKPAGKKGKVN